MLTTEHNSHNGRRQSLKGRILDRYFYGAVDRVACISEGVRESLVDWMPGVEDKCEVIHNGVPLVFEHLPQRAERPKLRIVSVGRLHPQKNFDNAIRAIGRLEQRGAPVDYEYVIAGAGELESSLKALTSQLALEHRVRFLGHVSDVPSLLREADIFLIPSAWEGFGMAAVEAMNAGLPVVASDVSGLREVVGDNGEAGLRIDPQSTEAMAEALWRLLGSRSERLRMGEAGFERSRQFSEEKMIDQYVDLYHRLSDGAY